MLLRDKGQSFHHQRWQPRSFALNTGTTRRIVLLTASHAQRPMVTWCQTMAKGQGANTTFAQINCFIHVPSILQPCLQIASLKCCTADIKIRRRIRNDRETHKNCETMEFIRAQFPVLSHHHNFWINPHTTHTTTTGFSLQLGNLDHNMIRRLSHPDNVPPVQSIPSIPCPQWHSLEGIYTLCPWVKWWSVNGQKQKHMKDVKTSNWNLALLAFRHAENGSTWFYYQLKYWHCKLWKLTSCRKSANRHIMGQVSFSGWTRNVWLQFGLILLQFVPLPDQSGRHWHSSSGRNSDGKTSRIVLLWSNS